MTAIVLLVRVVQIICAALVLALSAVLIAQYGPGGHAPSLIDYGAFCGGAAVVIGLVGAASCFVEFLQGVIMLVLDGFASFFLLAGGIAFAATIKAGSCSDDAYVVQNQKTFFPSDKKIFLEGPDPAEDDIRGRCRMVQADTAFLWFTFACSVGALALSFVSRKSGLGGSIV